MKKLSQKRVIILSIKRRDLLAICEGLSDCVEIAALRKSSVRNDEEKDVVISMMQLKGRCCEEV